MFTVSSLPGFKGEVGAGGRVAEEQLALGVLHHWDQVARVYQCGKKRKCASYHRHPQKLPPFYYIPHDLSMLQLKTLTPTRKE